VRAGADEGAFAWLTLNYLLGNLGKGEARTMAAIDLGGGSVQQAYALTAFEAAAAPDGYITKLAGGGRTYLVYVHRRAACWAAAPAQKPHSGGRLKPDACRDCVATARAATWALG